MFIQPRHLSIITTRKCTAACDHCCVGAGPRETQSIPVERIHALITEATRVPSLELIGFTGGECFLLGSELDRLIAHASRSGFRTRAITNGYWAIHREAARVRVAALRRSGLAEMMISTGTFHQKYVPVERVLHAARAAADAGLQVRVSVEECDQTTFDAAMVRLQLEPYIAARRIVVSADPWIEDSGGRGTTALSHTNLMAREPQRELGRCAQILNVVSVTPAQELVACCGFPLEQLPALALGSVADRALDDVLRDAQPDLLKLWLHTEGPASIERFVARYVPGFSLPRTPSICHACAALQRDPRAMQVLEDHAIEGFEALATGTGRAGRIAGAATAMT